MYLLSIRIPNALNYLWAYILLMNEWLMSEEEQDLESWARAKGGVIYRNSRGETILLIGHFTRVIDQ